MTTPTAFPASPQGGPAGGARSRRIYVYWAIALTLLLAAGAFCWAVVVPVWKVRSHLARLSQAGSHPVAGHGRDWVVYVTGLRNTVKALGGPGNTSRRIFGYFRHPEWIAPHRAEAVDILMECGEQGKATLREIAAHGRSADREYAAEALKAIEKLEALRP